MPSVKVPFMVLCASLVSFICLVAFFLLFTWEEILYSSAIWIQKLQKDSGCVVANWRNWTEVKTSIFHAQLLHVYRQGEKSTYKINQKFALSSHMFVILESGLPLPNLLFWYHLTASSVLETHFTCLCFPLYSLLVKCSKLNFPDQAWWMT